MNDVFNIPLNHGVYKDTFRNNSKYFHKKDSENNKKAKEFKLIEDGIIFVKENIIEKEQLKRLKDKKTKLMLDE